MQSCSNASDFHVRITPSEITLERAMQFIKGGQGQKELALNMEIWERGYVDHRIRMQLITPDTLDIFDRTLSKPRL